MRTVTKKIDKNGMKVGNTQLSGEGTVDIVYPEDLVAVRDYVTSKGYSGTVDWDGKKPTIGGEAVEPQHIERGIAYVLKSDADRAITNMEKRSGAVGMDGAKKARDEKYGKMEDDAMAKITSREKFSYDTDTDPAFLAYSNVYHDLAEHAYRRVLNDNNASVTGASSVVLSEAMAAKNRELLKLAEMVPELYENAYTRYRDDAERDRSDLETISSVADEFYDRLYKQNLDAVDATTSAGEAERREKQRWIDNGREETEAYYDNILRDIDIEKGNIDVQKGNIELEGYGERLKEESNSEKLAQEKQAMDNALARGFFIESDELAMPWLADYRTANGYSISPSTAALAYEYQTAHTREVAKINAKLGR